MDFLAIVLIAAVVFGICYLLDRGFARLFRGKPEHATVMSVRFSSKAAAFGLIVAVIGVAAIITGSTSGGWLFFVGGGLMILVGVVLLVQYLCFGVFYGEESFVFTTFGKPSITYAYRDIVGQQLYNSQGNIVIELHMADGGTVMLQSGMKGVYPFLDYAFGVWLRQTGRAQEDCTFYDPDNSKWFPPVGE